MNKLVIRKGLFETSSSSEDSLSVYQDMSIFVLPQDLYQKFEDNELYLKLCTDSIIPMVAEDYNWVKEENKRVAKKYKIKLDNNGEVPYYYCFTNRNSFYINYETYIASIRHYFYDVEFFNKENNDEVIFGFYGYIED